MPSAENAGSYPVYWRVKTNDYGIDDHGSFTVKVSKANLTVTPPTGLTKKYNGSTQKLADAGSVLPAGKGTMKYSLNPEMNNWADTNWSEDIPERTNARGYKVYYRVFPSDTKNYEDSFDKTNPTFVNAEITKLTAEDFGDDFKVVPADDWTYDGVSRKLINETETKLPAGMGLSLMYQTDSGKWDYTIPTGTDAGDYKVKWKVTGNDNVDNISGEFTVHVAKKTPEVKISKKADWVYDGKTYQLLQITENNDNLRFTYSVNGGALSTVIPGGREAGAYKISVTSQPNDNYETYQGSFEVKCSPAAASGSVTANTLTFNYGEQELVAPNDDVTNGRMMYKVEGESAYSDTIPKRTNAGTYKVWYYVKGTDANYADTVPASVDVTIAPYTPVPKTNVSTGLVYNKAPQTLLTVDTEGHHGTVKYAVKTDGTTPSDSDWTTDIPKATNATGDESGYKVYWKVFDDSGRDDGEKNLTEPSGVETVKIAKYPATIAYVHAEDLPYNGEAQQLVEEIKARNDMGTVKYAVTAVGETPSDWSDNIPTGTDAGTYRVWFKIEGDDNIENVAPQSVDVTITKVVPDVKVTVKAALEYNPSTEQDLINSATVDVGKGGGQLLFAVTDSEEAVPADGDWSAEHPKKNEIGTYYVWYKFVGDRNTENVKRGPYTSVIAADAPNVTVSGKHLDYSGEEQELATGTTDKGQLKYWVTTDKTAPAPAPNDPAWSNSIPKGTDAGTYYVWYYVPAEVGVSGVPASKVEAEIKKGPAIEYDYAKELPEKLTATGKSFTVPYGTRIGAIPLNSDADGDGSYAWHADVESRTLTTVGGPYNYPAYFTSTSGNYESGIVQISIYITKIPEDTPEIKIDYIAEKLTGFDPSKTYTIWGGEHTDSTTLTITDGTDGTVNRMDNNKTEIVLKASTNHTTDSKPQELTIPTRPPAPELKADGGDIEVYQPSFLTAPGRVDGISDAMEYRIGDSNTWITGSNKELTVPQNTKVYVRYKAVADAKFKSFPLEVSITESQRRQVTMDDKEVKISFLNHTLIPEPDTLTPNTKYTVTVMNDDGTEGQKYRAETDEKGEFPIEEDWHGKTVKIVKSGDILYTVDSEPKYKYIPERPDAPEPDSRDSKITDVVNNALRRDEYRLVTDNGYTDVENATETNEVTPDKYVVRTKATPTTFASLDSYVVIVKEKTPNAQIDYVKETLNNLDKDTEYIITEPEGNKITVLTDANGEIPIKDNWFGVRENGENKNKTVKIQKKGKSEEFDSPEQERPIPPRPDAPEPDSWDSKITEVSSRTMEYRLASAYDAYKPVENATETNVVVPDDYEVRIKAVEETDTTIGNFASLPATVTVNPMPKPNGSIDYKEVKIKDLEPGKEYTVIDEKGNEETCVADENGKITIKEEWMDTDIEIIRNGEDAQEDSEAQTIHIPKRPDPPHPSSRDSKITDVDDKMEYRPKQAADDKYVPVEDGKTESPVVAAGEYAVRYEPTPTTFPSLPAYVTVAPTGNGGGGRGRANVTPTPAPSTNPDNDSNQGGGNGGGNIPSLNKTDHFAYISGYEDGTFRPDRTITRGEAAVIFARLMTDFDSTKSYTPSFPDLTEDMYFYSYVGYLEQYGIITGYEDGTFRPWENVTRTEFAVIASKFAELSETEENIFTDVSDDFWGKPFILLAHKNGWVNGYEDGTFRPEEQIKRAEVVSIVNRMLERSCDMEFDNNHTAEIKQFNDVSGSHWAYKDILEAANGHLYTTVDGGEVWTDLI